MQGACIHLWFLSGLLCSLSISAFFIRLRRVRILVAMALALYATGLAGMAYGDSPIGFHANFNFRNGPFFALIFFVTGYLLERGKAPCPSWFPIGLSVAIIGAALHFSELLLLHGNWRTSMVQDYVVGTYFFGVGVAVMALSNDKMLAFPHTASIGPLVPGMYASHYIFVYLLEPVNRNLSGNKAWTVSYPVVVFLFSCLLAFTMSRSASTKRLVT